MGQGPLQRAVHDALNPGAETRVVPSNIALIYSIALTVICLVLMRRRITKPVRI